MNEITPAEHFRDAEAVAPEALQKRYREPAAAAGLPWSETLSVLLNHRSVRAFSPEPLAEGTREVLVAAAQSAPSSSNVQALSIVSVEDPALRAQLAAIAGNQKHIETAGLFFVFVADLSRVQRLAEREGLTSDGLDYTESFLIASLDAAFAAQNTLVAAQSLGLGAVYIGALRNDAAAVAHVLKLPPRAYAVVGLAIGRPDPAVATDVKPRIPQPGILHRDVYSTVGEDEALARADRHALAFRAEQGLDATPWTRLALQRLHAVASLKGRHVLRRQLEALGFPFK
ncbi:nitroreductase family protein [Ancylobacter defluvii]|uniref:NADPH-dependent oxidoreductase n=1 Tax=Ancylobacter defluvii TaxID=1282440 RepID=A0A9W6JXF9_9HYPH|nr:nitroreductase family protein [Ancylobacter defluvii]GLK83900.1 NADPH-dependent oxidoreductase [Ancylobacter defluvii]